MSEIVVAVITGLFMLGGQWVATRPHRRKIEEARASAATAAQIVQGNGKGDVAKMLSDSLVLLGRIDESVRSHQSLPASQAHPKRHKAL